MGVLLASSGDISLPAIITLAVIIIISHFLNVYSEKTGVPSVLVLILFGVFLQLDVIILDKIGYYEVDTNEMIENVENSIQENNLNNIEINEPKNKTKEGLLPKEATSMFLKILGIVGLILILLEAALDLKINKTMVRSSLSAFYVGLFGLIGTSFLIAFILQYFNPVMSILQGLLYGVPLSIISSAIIIPSIQGFNEKKKSFLIYESTFSDVLGLLMFSIVIGALKNGAIESPEWIVGKLILTILFSVFISLVIIYLFQKIKGHTKLFLLFAVLILLYSVGELFHLPVLLIVLIFGIILNNYESVFKGFLSKLINPEKIDTIRDDFKIIIMESAFVVRTFFFILFGYYVSLEYLANEYVIIISCTILVGIYLTRYLVSLPILGSKVWPEVFLSPRGLITILLFFQIADNFDSLGLDAEFHDTLFGVFLFVILGTAITMSNSLIEVKNKERLANANGSEINNSENSNQLENDQEKDDNLEEEDDNLEEEDDNLEEENKLALDNASEIMQIGEEEEEGKLALDHTSEIIQIGEEEEEEDDNLEEEDTDKVI